MPNLLAFDTSSDNCSVSIYHDSHYESSSLAAPRKHTQLILPMIEALMKEHGCALNDIDAIGFGCGPGSFTGIRIAAGVAQGLGFGLDSSVYPISNLEALALQGCKDKGITTPCLVLAAIDARMDEVYWSVCLVNIASQQIVKTLVGESVGKPESICLSGHDLPELDLSSEALSVLGINLENSANPYDKISLLGVGSGFDFLERFPEEVKQKINTFDSQTRPHAQAICELTKAAWEINQSPKLSDAVPSYVRDTVTWKKLPGRE